MNKKWIGIIAFAVLIVAVLLSFAFCNRNEEPTVEPTVAPTEAATEAPTDATEPPAPTEPEWVLGYSRASYAEAIYATLEKGAEVEVISKFMDYFVISGEKHDLLVEERFVRLESEEAFESWNGYARSNTNVFESVYMREEPIAKLATNTRVKVLDGKGDWLFIEWDDGKGYVKAADISKTRITGHGGGGAANVPADGTDVDVGSLSFDAQDSYGVVTLGNYYGPEMEEGFEKGAGVVLAEGIEAYVALYNHDGEVKVLEYDDEFCTVYLDDGVTGKLPRYLVRLEGDEQEEPWIGFAHKNAVAYKRYQRRDEEMTLNLNDEVKVLYKLPGIAYGDDGVYVVLIDGEVLYMNVYEVSEERIKPAAGGGGGGTGGSVWTPPAL